MKILFRIFIISVWLTFTMLYPKMSSAQVAAHERSSKSAAQYDAQCIAGNIQDIQDILFLSQKAAEQATDTRVKESAQVMLTDYTTILYSMEQLASAGFSSSNNNNKETAKGVYNETTALNGRLSAVRGSDFDTLWVSSLLVMGQTKYDELTIAKENVTNSQLKMAVTEAIPVIRRHITQLKSLQKSLIKMALQKKKEASLKHNRK